MNNSNEAPKRERFRDAGGAATAWSVIVRTRVPGPVATRALDTLFRRYETSVLAMIRAKRLPPGDSPEDIKQLFFTRAIARQDFARLEPELGSFRGWLKVSVSRLIASRWSAWKARKRGNGVTDELAHDAGHEATPLDLFERKFAESTMAHARELLREEQSQKITDEELWQELERQLPGGELNLSDLAHLAARLAKTSAATAVFRHRLQKRYALHLRSAVGETLDLDPNSPDAEAMIDRELARMHELLGQFPTLSE